MRFPDDVADDVQLRLRRLEGQIRGIQRMLDEGKDCESVVTQLAAAKAALDRVGYRLVAAGMRHCIADPAPGADVVDGPGSAVADDGAEGAALDTEDRLDVETLERLFLKLS